LFLLIFAISIDDVHYCFVPQGCAAVGETMRSKQLFARSASYGAALLAASVLAACGGNAELGGDSGNSLGGDTAGGAGGGTATVRIGSLAGGSFQSGQIAIDDMDLAAGGSTGLTVDIVDSASQLASGTSYTVIFSSSCAATGTASFNQAEVTTSTGRASATYTAKGCAGSDQITAKVAANSAVLTATGTVTVLAAALGGVEFVSATPAIIGMTGSPIPSQAEMLFRLKDASGGNLAGRTVQFTLNTAVGGITLTPASATSDANGIVRTVVQAGSVATSVRVKAESVNPINGLTISSQSEVLTISTGLPDSDSVSISAERHVLDGACDGESTSINIRAADRYNNPVPEGTAFSFRTEGGKINAQCVTGNPLGNPVTEAGVCSVLLTVQNPRPTDGRVTVLASALGEESFIDANGNGFYDANPPELFDDVGEAFVDYNENGIRDNDEPFIDGSAGGNAGVYDGSNGSFDGYVCSEPGKNCSYGTVHVSDDIVIVFSRTDAQPLIVRSPAGAIAIQVKGTQDVGFVVSDVNGNSFPTGTTYSLNVDVGSVLEPAVQGPFNNSSVGGDISTFTIKAPATTSAPGTDDVGTGTFSINIPASGCSGTKSYFANFPITITN
jgi:hypothetical protein